MAKKSIDLVAICQELEYVCSRQAFGALTTSHASYLIRVGINSQYLAKYLRTLELSDWNNWVDDCSSF